MLDATTHVRIARPSNDLAAAERFYVDGLGLTVLYRVAGGDDEHDLLMLGLPGSGWHLELVHGADVVAPQPSSEDLLVLYLGAEADEALVTRLEHAGGRRVSQGPYWDRWAVTMADPDGYRLVLSQRDWTNV